MNRFDVILMHTAVAWSSASHCNRLRVGCVIAKHKRIIATGYNGTLPGDDNCCEENNVTKSNVVHAEQNAIIFCAKHGLATDGCELYVTTAPCETCAKLIVSAGITTVFYKDFYRCHKGVELLNNHGISTHRITGYTGIKNDSPRKTKRQRFTPLD